MIFYSVILHLGVLWISRQSFFEDYGARYNLRNVWESGLQSGDVVLIAWPRDELT